MNVFKSTLYIFLLCIIASCSHRSENQTQKPIVAVSIEPQRQILESLAGDEYDVVTILSRGANPETFEPTMSQQALVAKADAFVSLGVFPFENVISSVLKPGAEYVDCTVGVDWIYGTHGHNHRHDINDVCSDSQDMSQADPHYWTSLRNSKVIAKNMTDALSRLNPDKSRMYNQRFDSLTAVIDSLDMSIRHKLADANRSFAVWHPSLTYFANEFDLNQLSVGYESKEVSPRKLQGVINEAKSNGIRVMFYQKEFDSRQAQTVNGSIGSRLVAIDPLAYDWMSQLNKIADELTK